MVDTPYILIVDDDSEIRDLLSRFLTRNGYRVSVAREEREMRKVLQVASIELIVFDAMLPGKDGFTICREIRATGNVPIIMLTAVGDEADRIVGLEMSPAPFDRSISQSECASESGGTAAMAHTPIHSAAQAGPASAAPSAPRRKSCR
jgi:CheY-like chemotaxis protein